MRLCIIGAFAFETMATGGQQVKTRNLYWALEKEFGNQNVSYVETIGWRRHPLSLLLNITRQFKRCDCLIMLPAQNGVLFLSIILLLLKRIFSKPIYYDVIGGWLPGLLENNKRVRKWVSNFNGVWVETLSMKERLTRLGLCNVKVIYNFKNNTPVKEDDLNFSHFKPYRICTFSRVLKEKGIEDAINAVIKVNSVKGLTFTLDIYGEIDNRYKESFDDLINSVPKYVSYCNSVVASESVDTLRDYFALLFPTYYEGEGFAGTILDSLMAGVPIIASDWRYNAEIVNNSVGFIFPNRDVDGLANILNQIAENPDIIINMKRNCLIESRKYSEKEVIKRIKNELSAEI